MSLNGCLPDELLLDILYRLPVKTLKRFMCVSKSWLSTFRDPIFTRTHYLRNTAIACPNREVLIKIVNSYSGNVHHEHYFVFSQENPNVRVRIYSTSIIKDLASSAYMIGCEGLAFIYNPNDLTSCKLLNPSTREFKALPHSEFSVLTEGTVIQVVGLGYDYKTNDYKVVRLLNNYSTKVVEVYSLSSNSWREIQFNLDEEKRQSVCHTSACAYLNGYYHWWGDAGKEILYFDMVQEIFQNVAFPIELSFRKPWLPVLTILFGQFVAVMNKSKAKNCFDIYVMREHGIKESWTKHLIVGPILGVSCLLGSWIGGDQWIFITYHKAPELGLYDSSKNVVKRLRVCGTFNTLALVIFTENMLSLN